MGKLPIKRAVGRPARVSREGLMNQSHAAGAPAPASAAATGAFYTGADEPDIRPNAPQSETQIHADSVRGQATHIEPGLTAEGPLSEPGDDLAADIARVKAMRRPLGVSQQKLALPKRSGYHTHWFNDEGGRIDDALANGWAHRKDKDGKPLKRAVGRGRDAGVLYAYAMDIPEIYWQEDQAAKNQNAADKMESLKAAPFQAKSGQAQKSDSGKFYSPVEGSDPITIEKR